MFARKTWGACSMILQTWIERSYTSLYMRKLGIPNDNLTLDGKQGQVSIWKCNSIFGFVLTRFQVIIPDFLASCLLQGRCAIPLNRNSKRFQGKKFLVVGSENSKFEFALDSLTRQSFPYPCVTRYHSLCHILPMCFQVGIAWDFVKG